MHELSLVMSILQIAEENARNAGADHIEEIELDMGELSGVEPNAFDFAWNQATQGTLLENAQLKINRIRGEVRCLDCSHLFPASQLYESCPSCGSHWQQILQGKEFRVKTLLVSSKETA